jgi:hypothetical protein
MGCRREYSAIRWGIDEFQHFGCVDTCFALTGPVERFESPFSIVMGPENIGFKGEYDEERFIRNASREHVIQRFPLDKRVSQLRDVIVMNICTDDCFVDEWWRVSCGVVSTPLSVFFSVI